MLFTTSVLQSVINSTILIWFTILVIALCYYGLIFCVLKNKNKNKNQKPIFFVEGEAGNIFISYVSCFGREKKGEEKVIFGIITVI